MKSERFSFNFQDLKKVGRSAIYAGIGATVTYLLQYFQTVDFGGFAPLATAIFGWLACMIKTWVSVTEYPDK